MKRSLSNKLSRVTALLVFFIGPYLLNILVWHMMPYGKTVGIFIMVALIYSWYLFVINKIKQHIGMNPGREIFLKIAIIIAPVFAIVSTFDNLIVDSPDKAVILKAFLIAGTVGIILGQAGYYMLAQSFRLLLRSKGIESDPILVFIHFAIFPIAIWLYQDKLKEWSEDDRVQNLLDQ